MFFLQLKHLFVCFYPGTMGPNKRCGYICDCACISDDFVFFSLWGLDQSLVEKLIEADSSVLELITAHKR